MKLAWWFVTQSNGIENGGDNIGEVQCPTLQDDNPKSGLNWLCLAMILFKAFFMSEDFLQDENLRSMIERWQCLYTPFFLKMSLLEKLTPNVVLVVLVLQLQGINHWSGTFLLCNSFLVVCICIATRALHCCKARYNWYLLDINIYSLLKKDVL
jgi:hypothetical protein